MPFKFYNMHAKTKFPVNYLFYWKIVPQLRLIFFLDRTPDGGVCRCIENGNSTEIKYDDGQWCCHTNECKVVEYNLNGYVKIVECNGTALGLKQQCHNNNENTSTCNHYASDPYRNYIESRSYMDICQDGRYE